MDPSRGQQKVRPKVFPVSRLHTNNVKSGKIWGADALPFQPQECSGIRILVPLLSATDLIQEDVKQVVKFLDVFLPRSFQSVNVPSNIRFDQGKTGPKFFCRIMCNPVVSWMKGFASQQALATGIRQRLSHAGKQSGLQQDLVQEILVLKGVCTKSPVINDGRALSHCHLIKRPFRASVYL